MCQVRQNASAVCHVALVCCEIAQSTAKMLFTHQLMGYDTQCNDVEAEVTADAQTTPEQPGQ